MNKELLAIFNDFIGIMKRSEGILGAWNFGSAMHGLTDEYSDVDVVLLVEGDYFKSTEQGLNALLALSSRKPMGRRYRTPFENLSVSFQHDGKVPAPRRLFQA